MSVPPLVSSSPPPPDHCDDDLDDDEFGFNCTDTSFSPPNQFDIDRFAYDSEIVEKNISLDNENQSHLTDKKKENIQSNGEDREEYGKFNESLEINSNIRNDLEEENNIEDLDLKLNSLQIDFQNCKESADDSLNTTFDEFGMFFNSSTLNDSPETSFYLPKTDNLPNCDIFDKDSRSQETSSELSVSIHNEDNSDVDVVLEIPQDSPNHTIETENEYEKTMPIEEMFIDVVEKYSNSDVNENLSDLTSKVLNACAKCEINNCSCDNGVICDKSNVNDFEVNWSNNFDNDLTCNSGNLLCSELNTEHSEFNFNNNIAKMDPSIDEKLCDIVDDQRNIEIDDDFDDFEDFTTFKSGEINDILNASQHISNLNNINTIADVQFNIMKNKDENINDIKPDSEKSDSLQFHNINVDRDNNDDNDDGVDKNNDDDDFGDFDTYNANDKIQTVTENTENDFKINELLSENEILSSDKFISDINNIFSEDEAANNSEDLTNLELKSILGESWKHLVNYEVEQLYMFPWNNSASQKSLLKSLGIDSRNILFGPKWNVNMPRFAANLGSNPLQPTKRNIIPTATIDQSIERKIANGCELQQNLTISGKEINWENSSHLTSVDFQASSYAESLLLDLEHLMATLDQMTSSQSVHFKISDLFTNACNERGEDHKNIIHNIDDQKLTEEPSKMDRPLHPTVLNIGRKINLPDTHIFTPTDSETPWSHTIHYNDENFDDFSCNTDNLNEIDKSDIKPCENLEKFHTTNKNDTKDCLSNLEPINTFNIETTAVTEYNDLKLKITPTKDDIDDFGDFQSAGSDSLSAPQFSSLDLLEPIKITPTAPIVNWPEPGEVKTLNFDDFSFSDSLTNPLTVPSINSNSTDITSNTSYLPNLSMGPTKIILKESKIVSDADFVENTCEKSLELNIAEEKPNNKEDDAYSGFSNFNLDFNQTCELNSTYNINSDVLKSNESNLDDFDDFQSAKFVPSEIDLQNKYLDSTSSLSIFENEFMGKMKPIATNSNSLYNKPPLEPIFVRRPNEEYTSKNSSQQILQPLSLEGYSQINWPNPGIDLQDLTRFNPVDSIKSYSETKESTKTTNTANDQSNDDDGWSDFVSMKPTVVQHSSNTKPVMPNMLSCNGFGIVTTSSAITDDNDDWSDFVSSTIPSKPVSELKTISQNIQSQSTASNSSPYMYNKNLTSKSKTSTHNPPVNVNILPNLTYISPKTNVNRNYNNHFQNL